MGVEYPSVTASVEALDVGVPIGLARLAVVDRDAVLAESHLPRRLLGAMRQRILAFPVPAD